MTTHVPAAVTPTWLYDLALIFHLVGAFSLVSGTVVAMVSSEAARRRSSCSDIALLLGIARASVGFVAGGILVAGAFGLWLVTLGNWGYATPWVASAIGLLAFVTVAGAAGGQRPKRARKLAERLAHEGLAPTDELRSMLRARAWRWLSYAAEAALLAIIVLMVTKPGSP